MIYIKHSYNREVHTSIGKSPFETGFGNFPPSLLDVVYGQQGGAREDLVGDDLNAKKKLRRSGRSIFKYKRH